MPTLCRDCLHAVEPIVTRCASCGSRRVVSHPELFRLTVAECLAGVTREAAAALGLGSETGALEAGKACDLAIWNASNPAELVYRMGFNPLHARVREGR